MKRRAKLNSKNFRVSKTQVYIAKATPVKPAPREEMVEVIRRVWNKQSPKFLKHIKKLSIQRTTKTGSITGGWFDSKYDQIKFFDAEYAPLDQYELTAVHELAHANWWFLYKYHREELKKFCDKVFPLPPLTQYLKGHEKKWKKAVANQKILDNKDEYWANSWTNEIHSFIAEYLHNPDLLDRWTRPITVQRNVDIAIEAYKELHNITSDTSSYIKKESK